MAHEIGEHVAHRVFARWGADPRETAANAREQVANCLAGRLLLPAAWFAADAAACQWDLLALKARHSTASHELIARRMLECRPAVVISIFDQRRLSFRRSNVSGRVPPPSPAEIECWNSVHEQHRHPHGPAKAQTHSGVADPRRRVAAGDPADGSRAVGWLLRRPLDSGERLRPASN